MMKTPIFVNGMFNKDGHRIHADFVKEVRNGVDRFKLWKTSLENRYAADGLDKFYLFFEVGDYIAPLRLTERGLIWHAGEDDKGQAEYVKSVLREHINSYTQARDNGGMYADYVGAAALGEIEKCMELAAKIRSMREAEEKRQKKIAEENAARVRAEREAARKKEVDDAAEKFRSGGLIDDGELLIELAEKCGVQIPIRTRGWILKSFGSCKISVEDGRTDFSIRYYKKNNGSGSTKIFEIVENIRSAVSA